MSLILDRLAKLADLSKEESTILTVAAAVGAVSITVKNIQGFSSGDYIVIGDPGTETAEIVKVSSAPSGYAIAVGALSLAHGVGAPVNRCSYNKVKIYRSDTESGTFAEITGSPFTMEVDQPYTYAIDATGTAAKWYKFSYYNSDSTVESDKSAAYLGGNPAAICTLEDVKTELGIKLSDKSADAQLLRLINSVSDEIIGYTGVQWVSKSISDEYHDIDGGQERAYSNYYPILTVSSVYDDGQALTYDSDPSSTDYHIYDDGIAAENGCFTPGKKRLKLSYVAYKAPPEEVKECAIQMVAIRSGKKVRTFVDGEGITQAVLMTSIPKDIWEKLDRYKRRVF